MIHLWTEQEGEPVAYTAIGYLGYGWEKLVQRVRKGTPAQPARSIGFIDWDQVKKLDSDKVSH